MSELHKSLEEIEDTECCQLIRELALIAGIDSHQWRSMMMLHFLQQSVYPNGAAEKPVPISKDDLDTVDPFDAFILRKKIKDLGNALHMSCAALPFVKTKGIENFHGSTLYVFLGKALIPKKTKIKPSRW
jgi:hypothetical protein